MCRADSFLPIPIKWVLVLDPEGELDPVPLISTDLAISPEEIIGYYFKRWNIEVTFEEVREHLGAETQRQWSDKAIARTTPILLGLYTKGAHASATDRSEMKGNKKTFKPLAPIPLRPDSFTKSRN